MITKTENCLYCGEKMESITAKKKFCCDLHRVYWNREQKKPELLGVLNTEKGVTVINPVDGAIIEDHPNPTKPKNIKVAGYEFPVKEIEGLGDTWGLVPKFKNDVERMFWEEEQKLKK